jgi:predicted kinase
MDLVIFIGLQASGKSSLFRARFAATHAHVSKDHFPHARRREQRQRRLVAEALAAGRSVVVDNTNPTRADRTALIALARAHGARVLAYFFDAPLPACLARNRTREGRACVPDVALFATAKKLERPAPDEGFDAIYHVRLHPVRGFEIAVPGACLDTSGAIADTD